MLVFVGCITFTNKDKILFSETFSLVNKAFCLSREAKAKDKFSFWDCEKILIWKEWKSPISQCYILRFPRNGNIHNMIYGLNNIINLLNLILWNKAFT